jgi:hypothetical protein
MFGTELRRGAHQFPKSVAFRPISASLPSAVPPTDQVRGLAPARRVVLLLPVLQRLAGRPDNQAHLVAEAVT